MEVKCPTCSSRFNLPDAAAKEGVKLRCSVCKHVFALSKEMFAPKEEAPQPATEQKKKRFNTKLILFVAVGLILAILAGIGSIFFFGGNEHEITPPSEQELAKKVAMLTMRNVRQYFVDNEKAGKVFVIEGRVVNEFPEPKELIAVEAGLYDKDKKPLAIKKQLAGTQLSLFQLQVLSEKEMESFLNNKVEILTNNTNVRTGGDVPFMVLFYAPPAGVAEFGVRIVDVKDVPLPGGGAKQEEKQEGGGH